MRVGATPAETTLRLDHVGEPFDLSGRHRDVHQVALLPTAYPHYRSTFAELHNDPSATQPTVELFTDLIFGDGPVVARGHAARRPRTVGSSKTFLAIVNDSE